MSFEKFKQEDARLVVLKLLADQNDRSLNEFLIQIGLREMAHSFTIDQVRSELEWLKEQGLVKVEEVMDGVRVAKLLRRGQEAAEGIATIPGVKRPSPGDI